MKIGDTTIVSRQYLPFPKVRFIHCFDIHSIFHCLKCLKYFLNYIKGVILKTVAMVSENQQITRKKIKLYITFD